MAPQPGTLTKDRLQRAGWAAIANATLSMIPLVLLYMFGVEGPAVMGWPAAAGLTLLSLVLTLFILRIFRQLLNTRFQFKAVDDYISALIWGNIVTAGFSLLSLGMAGMEETLNFVSVFAFLFFGIVSIMFGMRLLRLKDGLFGLLKPFCYTTLATGICFATVVLIPLGIFLGSISDIMLATIFFRASEQPVPPIIS